MSEYSNNNLTYLETGSDDPFYNLAFEEYVLMNRKDGDYLILWQNSNTVVIGVNQITQAEINASWVRDHNVNVARRITGGGAVYHDSGNLNYSFITDYHSSDQLSMERFTAPIVRVLKDLGINAQAGGKNDILANGKKISGTAQKITGQRILHHGTLLFDSDPDAIACALNADPDKFTGKNMRSVKSRVGNIRPMLETDMTIREFWNHIRNELTSGHYLKGSLTDKEKEEVIILRDSKYITEKWNYGRSPAAQFHSKARFPGGTLEVYADLNDNIIRRIRFYGDFLSRMPLDGLYDALEGSVFKPDSVSDILTRFPLDNLLGSITASQVIDLLFYNTIV